MGIDVHLMWENKTDSEREATAAQVRDAFPATIRRAVTRAFNEGRIERSVAEPLAWR